jgi:hypothetical protein
MTQLTVKSAQSLRTDPRTLCHTRFGTNSSADEAARFDHIPKCSTEFIHASRGEKIMALCMIRCAWRISPALISPWPRYDLFHAARCTRAVPLTCCLHRVRAKSRDARASRRAWHVHEPPARARRCAAAVKCSTLFFNPPERHAPPVRHPCGSRMPRRFYLRRLR